MARITCVAMLTVAVCFLFRLSCSAAGGLDDERLSHCGYLHGGEDLYWGYNAEEAYSFGLKIQNAVQQEDLAAFFSLVDTELVKGPSRKYVENKSFGDIFSESWRTEILNSEPECTPVGWRGFMLANGRIWYRHDPFRIIAVSDWFEEEFPPVPTGWIFDGKILYPRCFVYEWLSGDNFETFEERFVIQSVEDFRDSPGKYFGDPIYPFESVVLAGKQISLWRNIEDCAGDIGGLLIENEGIRCSSIDGERECLEQYRLLAEVSSGLCQELAPELPGKCLKSYLVEIVGSGGSMSSVYHGIYGLFLLEDGERLVFPLKTFPTRNHARNFLDDR